ncbi:U1 snRNP protein involved in splicing [Pseudozyma hubeiensis SY62]|uniref:U1 snRNP protein involved in splicing n=1 Tax=Pseudozyma hubeiensis (strain SY62) TaxID=1305764 RepID=R9P275_PSEHS|nr:U1 snRNP protein involved in splicing [Pseudozyma hubeiensis SY62]GAC95396.1 U1 snRNP protein involved in splicing [Pseudozyma hubeiensis SY62]
MIADTESSVQTHGQDYRTHESKSSFGSSVSFHTVFSSISESSFGSSPTTTRQRSGCALSSDLDTPTVDTRVPKRERCIATTHGRPTLTRHTTADTFGKNAEPSSRSETDTLERSDLLQQRQGSRETDPEHLHGHPVELVPKRTMSSSSHGISSRGIDTHEPPFEQPPTRASTADLNHERQCAAMPKQGSGQATEDEDTFTSGSSAVPTSPAYVDPSANSCVAHLPCRKSTSASTLQSTKRNSQSTIWSDKEPHKSADHSTLTGSIDWGANFWCVVRDPFLPDNTFFANPQTGECRWTLPAGTMVLPPNDAGEWWQLLDEQTEQEYYYHTRTQESRWTRPDSRQGIVIPMLAIQNSTHVTRATKKASCWDKTRVEQDASSADKVEAIDSYEIEQGVVTTPLRPRTKSLPLSMHRLGYQDAGLMRNTRSNIDRHLPNQNHKSKFTSKDNKKEENMSLEESKEDLAKRARRSILIRDQKILEHARQTSGPPFRPDPTLMRRPTAARHPRPSTTGAIAMEQQLTRAQFPSTSDARNPLHSEFRSGPKSRSNKRSNASSSIVIQKIGKGLAFNATSFTPSISSSSALHHQRSLPFLHLKRQRSTMLVDSKSAVQPNRPVQPDRTLQWGSTRPTSQNGVAIALNDESGWYDDESTKKRTRAKMRMIDFFACFTPRQR